MFNVLGRKGPKSAQKQRNCLYVFTGHKSKTVTESGLAQLHNSHKGSRVVGLKLLITVIQVLMVVPVLGFHELHTITLLFSWVHVPQPLCEKAQ